MKILDSGERTEFDTGAVRDGAEGKGRMDLLPCRALLAMAELIFDDDSNLDTAIVEILTWLKGDRGEGNRFLKLACKHALDALEIELGNESNEIFFSIVEVSKVFEAGAKKYDARNWEKGIPLSRFVDSGLRHAMKEKAGMDDEPHLAMCCWNFLCCLDTLERISDGTLPEELDDLPNSDPNKPKDQP